MLIVGYDNNEQMFIVRNSWGEEWAERGYCKIPFNVMDYFSPPDGFWIIAELEQAGNFALIRPGRAGAVERSKAPAMETGEMAALAAKMRDEIRSGLESEIASSSRKIDTLISGRPVGQNPRSQPKDGFKAAGAECGYCHGSGFCSFCSWGQRKDCFRCGGSGRCGVCAGTGYVW